METESSVIRIRNLLFLISVIAMFTLRAQCETPASNSFQSFYGAQVGPALRRLGDRTSLEIMGFGFAAIAGARTQDEEVRDTWRQNQRMSSEISELGNKFGTFAIPAVIALGQYALDRENSIHHIRGLVAVTILGSATKWSVQRERPNRADRYSFPSGHTYSAFTTATSLTMAYGWRAGVIMYPLATMVGLSRISDDYHWFSDVTAGAVLGILIGRATFFEESEAPASHAHWFPWVETETATVGLRWSRDW